MKFEYLCFNIMQNPYEYMYRNTTEDQAAKSWAVLGIEVMLETVRCL